MKRKYIGWSIFAFLLIVVIYGFFTAFEPQYSKAEIKQNIGGVLICNVVYYVDNHSGRYVVNYQYKNKEGNILKIGDGRYYNREWNKDEQLINWKNWTILRTGGLFYNDKVIIGDVKTQKWNEYEFSPDSIEKDNVWISLKIHSLRNYCCWKAFVTKIDNGTIEVLYQFRTNETDANQMGCRKIIYKVNSETGRPVINRVLADIQ